MEQNGWRQPIRYLVVSLIFVAIIWFIMAARPLISSLIIAALLAYVLHPIVNLIVRITRLSYNAAVNITYLLFLSILVTIPVILVPFAVRQLNNILPDVEKLLGRTSDLLAQPIQFGEIQLSLDTVVSDFEALLSQSSTFLVTNALSTISGITSNIVWVLVVLVSIYYLLKDSHLLITWIISLASPPYQHHVKKLLAEIDLIWGRFLRGQILLMLIVGTLSWIGGLAVGLPGAFVIGLTAGILDLIPSLGPTIAAIVAVAVAFVQGSTYLPISNVVFGLIILLIYIFVQQIENIWIRPAIMGRQLRLHPALIFIGVFSSLTLFGVLAALVVIPVMASIGVLSRYSLYRVRGIDPYPQPKSPTTTTDTKQIVTTKPTAKKHPAQTKGAETTITPAQKIVRKS